MSSSSEVKSTVPTDPCVLPRNSGPVTSPEKLTTDKVNSNEKHFETTSADTEINKVDSTNINVPLQNSAGKEENGRPRSLQNEIQTIEEYSENNTVIANRRSQSEITLSEYGHNDVSIEEAEEKKRDGCSQCLLDVCSCMSWYFKKFKDFTVSCFRCCGECNKNFYPNNSNEVQDENHVSNDFTDTFNYDIYYNVNADYLGVVENTETSTKNHCSGADDNNGGYDNAGADTVCDTTGDAGTGDSGTCDAGCD